jgi:hypothetical protein
VESHAFSRRRIQHHHLPGLLQAPERATFFRCGKTTLPIIVERFKQSDFRRTGNARGRSTNLKAPGVLGIAPRSSVSANLGRKSEKRKGHSIISVSLHKLVDKGALLCRFGAAKLYVG